MTDHRAASGDRTRDTLFQIPEANHSTTAESHLLKIFPRKWREYWLCLQEADIKRDLYRLQACFAMDVK